jgi:hypothetical protein
VVELVLLLLQTQGLGGPEGTTQGSTALAFPTAKVPRMSSLNFCVRGSKKHGIFNKFFATLEQNSGRCSEVFFPLKSVMKILQMITSFCRELAYQVEEEECGTCHPLAVWLWTKQLNLPVFRYSYKM